MIGRRSRLCFGSAREAVVAGLVIAAIMLAAYEAYQFGLYRPTVTARGQVNYLDGNRNRITAETRQILIRNRSYWQVELSPSVWRDCGADCAETLRKERGQ